jgi:hypothetical protein
VTGFFKRFSGPKFKKRGFSPESLIRLFSWVLRPKLNHLSGKTQFILFSIKNADKYLPAAKENSMY